MLYTFVRNDFQYKQTRANAYTSLDNIKALLDKNLPVYIATDEVDEEFRQQFRAHSKVYFWDDILQLHSGDEISERLVGLVEQLICARGISVHWHGPFQPFQAILFGCAGIWGHPIWRAIIILNIINNPRINQMGSVSWDVTTCRKTRFSGWIAKGLPLAKYSQPV